MQKKAEKAEKSQKRPKIIAIMETLTNPTSKMQWTRSWLQISFGLLSLLPRLLPQMTIMANFDMFAQGQNQRR
jgi:hypothetical protein